MFVSHLYQRLIKSLKKVLHEVEKFHVAFNDTSYMVTPHKLNLMESTTFTEIVGAKIVLMKLRCT